MTLACLDDPLKQQMAPIIKGSLHPFGQKDAHDMNKKEKPWRSPHFHHGTHHGFHRGNENGQRKRATRSPLTEMTPYTPGAESATYVPGAYATSTCNQLEHIVDASNMCSITEFVIELMSQAESKHITFPVSCLLYTSPSPRDA